MGQLSNLMSIPTDWYVTFINFLSASSTFSFFFCSAQRDERRGWLADAALAATQALYNFDLIKFYHNFLNRMLMINEMMVHYLNFRQVATMDRFQLRLLAIRPSQIGELHFQP